MALRITPGQPLAPLERFNPCIEDTDYCHLIQGNEEILLQGSTIPCSCIPCSLWGDNRVPNPTFAEGATEWTLDSWEPVDDVQICITGGGGNRSACATLNSYSPVWYRVVFETVITEGCLRFRVGGGDWSDEITESGSYEIIILGGTGDDMLCFETCSETNTMCINYAYAYPLECFSPGEGWTLTEIVETRNTPDPNLINGDFNTGVGWLLGPLSTISANTVFLNDYLLQITNIEEGQKYSLTFTTNMGGGTLVRVYLGGNLLDTVSSGTFTYDVELIEIDNQELRFETTVGEAEISAVSLTGVQNWIYVIKTVVCHNGNEAFTDPITFSNFLPLDTLIKVVFEIEGMTKGSVFMTVGSTNSDVFTSNGEYIRYLNSGSSQDLLVTPSADFDGCVRVVETCIMAEYESKLYDKDGIPRFELTQFLNYKNEYVTLIADPTQVCLSAACVGPANAEYNFGGITIDGVFSSPGFPVLSTDPFSVQEFLNTITPPFELTYTITCSKQVACAVMSESTVFEITIANFDNGFWDREAISLGGIAKTDVSGVNAALNALGRGSFVYTYDIGTNTGCITTEFNDNILLSWNIDHFFSCENQISCVINNNLNIEAEEFILSPVGGGEPISSDFECLRAPLPDGCYYVCISDPCPDPPIFSVTLLDIDFSSEQAAIDSGWTFGDGTTDTPGRTCALNTSGGGEILGGVIYDSIPGYIYKIVFDAAITVPINPSLELPPDIVIWGQFYPIVKSGHYEFIVNGSDSVDNIILFDTYTINHDLCITSFKILQGAPHDICTPCFKYTSGEFKNTKLITSTDIGEQFGFDFSTGFKLQQRVDIERFNPFYPEEKNDYKFSDGVRQTMFAEGESFWVLRIGASPENVHATLALQKSLRNFMIDGELYFTPEQEYRPEWGDPTSEMAEAQITIRKKKGTVYKR